MEISDVLEAGETTILQRDVRTHRSIGIEDTRTRVVDADVPDEHIRARHEQRRRDEVGCRGDITRYLQGLRQRGELRTRLQRDLGTSIRKQPSGDIGPQRTQHALTVVAGQSRFDDRGRTLRVEAGKQDRGLHLGTGNRGVVVDPVQLLPVDRERCTAVLSNRADIRPHRLKRDHDALHRALLYALISRQLGIEVLRGQDAGNKSRRGTRVSAVEHSIRLL